MICAAHPTANVWNDWIYQTKKQHDTNISSENACIKYVGRADNEIEEAMPWL